IPAPPPESEPAMVRAFGMGMGGGLDASDASKSVLADAALKQVDELSYSHSRESGNPGTAGRSLDSRSRGNDEYWRRWSSQQYRCIPQALLKDFSCNHQN